MTATPAAVAAATTAALVLTATLAPASCSSFVSVPVTSYSAPIIYPIQKVVAQEIAVAPLVVTVPVDVKALPVQLYGLPHYYSVGDAYREKAYLRDVIREELKQFLQQLPANGSSVNQLPSTKPPAPPKPSEPSNDQPVSFKLVPDDVTPPELQAKVLEAFRGRGSCLNCHGATGRANGSKGREFRLVMEDAQGNLVLAMHSSDQRWKIYGMAAAGAMPPAAANDADRAMEAKYLPFLAQYASIKVP